MTKKSGGVAQESGGVSGGVAQQSTLTIEQLAAQSGMTVRNIRAHRARGLLAAPEVRERVGYYSAEHLARLQLIQKMQADGFNLRAIQRMLEETHGPSEQLLSFREAMSVPFETEQSQVFTLAELSARFGGQVDGRELARAVRLGWLVALGEDRYEAPMPSLLDVAEEVVRRGVPLAHAVALVAKLREQCKIVAREFVKIFLEDLWKPFADAGYPQERWAEVTESIECLRPLSSRALLASYQITMSQEVEAAFGRELERLTKGRR
jgi:DNA-binding transcriptional MerR regulator